MRIHRTLRSAVIASLLVSGTAWASSDYLLQIEDLKDGAAIKGPPLEVMSFSFGASQPATVGNGSLSAGRMAASSRHQKTGHVTLMKREAAPGAMPSAPVAVGDVDGDGKTGAMAPRSPGPGTVTLHMDGSPAQVAARQASVCTQSKHFPSATLNGRGKTWVLSDVMVSSCAMMDGQQAVSLSYQKIEMR
jgi:hypothetical protein